MVATIAPIQGAQVHGSFQASGAAPVQTVVAFPAGWTAFLKWRETLLVALEELLRRVSPSEIVVGVACSTTPEQPERISEFMRSVVSENVQLAFETCRFLRSSASVMTLSLKSVHASSPRMIPRTACSASFAAFGRFSSRMPINRVNDAAHS